jgi:hypothetical protein
MAARFEILPHPTSTVPLSSVVVAVACAPKFGRSTACCTSSFQSMRPMSASTSPCGLNTTVGAIELRGRLPGSTRFATGGPSASAGSSEKSVSSRFSRNPFTICRLPQPLSMVVVMFTMRPSPSTIAM